MVSKCRRLVCGIGINDADYTVKHSKPCVVDGRRKSVMLWECPFYVKWKDMLTRCYGNTKYLTNAYDNISVCKEWLTFSNFRSWLLSQVECDEDLKTLDLDKDLLVNGSNEYSPLTCVLLPHKVNLFITYTRSDSSVPFMGVTYRPACKLKYEARCSNPFNGERESLGRYSTPEKAHTAWKQRKHELACELADSEYVTDLRVADALRTRYL